ncbi:MAG: alcohol dehydrogenase family protein [Sedimenticola sp.]
MNSSTKTMCGVLLTGHGGPEKLEFRSDIPMPQPGPRDVLIRITAAGVNNTDINTRTAWYSKKEAADDDATWSGEPLQFPRIQGIDACGEIMAAGREVHKSRIGERVIVEPCIREAGGKRLPIPWFLGSECDGGFAEYLVVASSHAYAIASSLSDVELASFPCSYSTAENMLTRAAVKEGERVLITGASGGVGSAAVQLAKARGATVIAVTTPSKAADLLKLGADQVVYRDESLIEALGTNSTDVVLDLVAGKQWNELLDLLHPGGRYAVAGAIGGPLVELDVRTLYLKDLTLFGCTVLEPEVFSNLVMRIENGQVSPLVAMTRPLEQIAEAQAAFQEKKHVGKIVLTVA